MNSRRFNQIAMAVLGALLLIFGTRTIMKIAFEEHEPEQASHANKPAEKPAGEAAGGDNILALIATADSAKGAEVAKKCQLCHNFDKGGPNLIGPNLYGVLGRKVASHEGYEYSDALKAKGGDWDYLAVDDMIEHPNVHAPGTKMALFQGLPDAKDRAEVIAFLRAKSDSPPPLPEAKAAPAAAPAGEPAGGAAKPAGAELDALLAKANPAKGAEVAKKCEICHNFEKGGPNLIGPNLYGVLGRKVASHEGYEYSDALKAKGGTWDYASVSQMDANPAAYVPGTKMALFQGLPDLKQRADLLAFMRTKSDNPPPLPEAAGAPAAEAPAAKPAEEKPAETAPAPAAPPSQENPSEAAPPPATPAPEEKPTEAAPPAAPTPEVKPAEAAPAPAAPASEENPAESAPPPAAEERPAETPATPAGGAMAPSYAPGEESKEQASPSQPQPVVPSESSEAAPAEAPAPSGGDSSGGAPADTSTQPQPAYPDGPPQ